jgi:hypothetical protein
MSFYLNHPHDCHEPGMVAGFWRLPMESLIFEQVTSALTVRSICSPMGPDIPAGTTSDELKEMSDEGLDPINYPSRVVDSDNDTVGVVWYGDYAFEEDDEGRQWTQIDEVMQHLEPNRLLSSSTTILDAVELFASKDNEYFYVIDINKIIGVLFYTDLFKPIGRLAFLSLALEIEDLAVRLCQSPKLSEKCWLAISDERKRKSIDLFTRRFSRKPCLKLEVRDQIADGDLRDLTEVGLEKPSLMQILRNPERQSEMSLLIGCTQLVDKATMLWKQKLITPATRSQVLGVFKELRDVRDSCAHPGNDEELLAKNRLGDFVISAMQMRKNLYEAMQNNREA